MNRFITLILMLTTLLTFTQKVMAFAPLLENETVTMVNCSMSMNHHQSQKDSDTAHCGNEDMTSTTDCQSDCEFMTVVSVLHFIEYGHVVSQIPLLLDYPTSRSDTAYYFPESLYRPPLIS